MRLHHIHDTAAERRASDDHLSRSDRAAEQRDAADEGRLEACGNAIVGDKAIVNQGEVVRPSQLIASVRRTIRGASDDKAGRTE
jgi:hypothetical protein